MVAVSGLGLKKTFPLHRFEEFGSMSGAELAALAASGNPPRHYKRGTRIRDEGVSPTSFYLLVDGWVTASHTVADGNRQIFKVHLPGDALGTPSMCVTHTAEELGALTDADVIEVPLQRFGTLFAEHPRLGARFLLSVQRERVALMDQLASVGRTSAQARLAAFLLDLLERLELVGAVQANGFDMLLTQGQIGDVVGLTAVHVNRTLRALQDQGLIVRTGRRIVVVDRPRMTLVAARPRRQRTMAPCWLPEAR